MESSKKFRTSFKKVPCLTKDYTTIFADKEQTNIFKKFYSTLADNLVKHLPPASSIFGLSSVCEYYNKTLKLPNTKFKFTFVSEYSVLKILKNIDENKAAGLDSMSGKFLKDAATILIKPLSQICNLSIQYSTFPNHYLRGVHRLILKTTVPYPYFL